MRKYVGYTFEYHDSREHECNAILMKINLNIRDRALFITPFFSRESLYSIFLTH